MTSYRSKTQFQVRGTLIDGDLQRVKLPKVSGITRLSQVFKDGRRLFIPNDLSDDLDDPDTISCHWQPKN